MGQPFPYEQRGGVIDPMSPPVQRVRELATGIVRLVRPGELTDPREPDVLAAGQGSGKCSVFLDNVEYEWGPLLRARIHALRERPAHCPRTLSRGYWDAYDMPMLWATKARVS